MNHTKPILIWSITAAALTCDADVDGRTCHCFPCQLIHRLCVVTSRVCRCGCQDDQLIVQGDCSVGPKQKKRYYSTDVIISIIFQVFQIFSLSSVALPSVVFKLRLWQDVECIWNTSDLERVKSETTHWKQASKRNRDWEGLNKSLLLSQIDMWLILCLFHSSGYYACLCTVLYLIHRHFPGSNRYEPNTALSQTCTIWVCMSSQW